MRKNLLLSVTFLMLYSYCTAQITATLQLPNSGIVAKSQLWNMAITNATGVTKKIRIELSFIEAQSGIQVMTASANAVDIANGSTQINHTLLQPITYTVTSANIIIDNNPDALLPAGSYTVCYHFFDVGLDANLVLEECEQLDIDPIMPPSLVYPEDHAGIETTQPVFTWLAPAPSNAFTNLTYDLDIVRMADNQTPTDAMEQNAPLFHKSFIQGNSFAYPATAPVLQKDKHYAWRITAKNGASNVGKTDVWEFVIVELRNSIVSNDAVFSYTKLSNTEQTPFTIASGKLFFAYTNELNDTSWQIHFHELGVKDAVDCQVNMDSIPMVTGQNSITLDLNKDNRLQNDHIYLLQCVNSRGEMWRLRFLFKKVNEE